ADHHLPAAAHTTEMGHGHLTESDRNPNRQLHPRRQLAVLEGLLHGQRAPCGPRRHPCSVAIGRPDREQRVTCELHDLAAVLADQLDQQAEAVVQQLGQVLDTAPPPPRPAPPSRSVSAVNPEMSANRTAATNRSLSASPNGSCRSAKRRTTS